MAGGIEVSDADIKDAVAAVGEKAAEEAVASFEGTGVGWSISGVRGGGGGSSGRRAQADEGLFSHIAAATGKSMEGGEIVADGVVTPDN